MCFISDFQNVLQQKLLIVIILTIHHISYTSNWQLILKHWTCPVVLSYEKNIQYQKLHKENHMLLDAPSLCICYVSHYWLWLVKKYNVCLASSGRNFVSKVGRESPAPQHTHTHTCALTEHGLHHKPTLSPQGRKRQTNNKQQYCSCNLSIASDFLIQHKYWE
jgi:hypothetical protein